MKLGVVEMKLGAGSIKIERVGREVVAKFDEADAEARKGYLAPNVVLGVINRRIGGVRACYSRALKSNPNLYGRLAVQFTIGPEGNVTEAIALDNSLNNKSLEDCILQHVRAWRFPKPKNGEVTIMYPFIFEQTF